MGYVRIRQFLGDIKERPAGHFLEQVAMAVGFGQMKKGCSVSVCHSGQAIVQMCLMNVKIDLNSWRENIKERPAGHARTQTTTIALAIVINYHYCYYDYIL